MNKEERLESGLNNILESMTRDGHKLDVYSSAIEKMLDTGYAVIINSNGAILDQEAAIQLMDDEIREQLHNELAPCTEDAFFRAYEKAHEEKYGKAWELSNANPTW